MPLLKNGVNTAFMVFPHDRQWLASQCGPKILLRGQFLEQHGHVRQIRAMPNGFSGLVRGSQGDTYKTMALFHGKHLQSSCSCPFDWGPMCKHVVALIIHSWNHKAKPITLDDKADSFPEEDIGEVFFNEETAENDGVTPGKKMVSALASDLTSLAFHLGSAKPLVPLRIDLFFFSLFPGAPRFGVRFFRKDKNKPVADFDDFLQHFSSRPPEEQLLRLMADVAPNTFKDGAFLLDENTLKHGFSLPLLLACEHVASGTTLEGPLHPFVCENRPWLPCFVLNQKSPLHFTVALNIPNGETPGLLFVSSSQTWLLTPARLAPVVSHPFLEFFSRHERNGTLDFTGPQALEFYHRLLPALKNQFPFKGLESVIPPVIEKEELVLEMVANAASPSYSNIGYEFVYASGTRFPAPATEQESPLYEGENGAWHERNVEKEMELLKNLQTLARREIRNSFVLWGREWLDFQKRLKEENPAGLILKTRGSMPTYMGELDWNFEVGVDCGGGWFSLKPSFIAERNKLSEAAFRNIMGGGDGEFFGYWGNQKEGYYSCPNDEVEQLESVFNPDFASDAEKGFYELPLYQLFSLFAVFKARKREANLPPPVREKLDSLLHRLASPEGCLPKKFRGKLRPYQKEGYEWLSVLKESGLSGLLADDMGLGKTVQTLALLSKATEENPGGGPHLIVAPTSVVPQWQEEARKFTPHLKTLVLERGAWEKQIAKLGKYHLVMTSYALLPRQQPLLESRFHYCVLDEAQMIKNPQTTRASVCKQIKSLYRLALTGTPIENRLLELWSIFDFLLPGFLGNRGYFKTRFESPIEKRADKKALSLLLGKIKPFVLRRLKAEVEKDLPEKTEEYVYTELSPAQKALYTEIVAQVREDVFCAIRTKGLKKSGIEILTALLKLRQVCCHPSLAGGKKDGESSKLTLLLEMLNQLREEGHRALVFSQFVGMLTIIKNHVEKAGHGYEYLDGSTTDRRLPVSRFMQDEKIPFFLLSLKAGGFGLNLTAADYVIHYDPWWNPAVENQATDRAHRIGQTKKVIVYKLIARDTIEEKILGLQKRKKELSDSIINGETGFVRGLTMDSLEELFAPLP